MDGEIHLILSDSVPDDEVDRLQAWFGQHGLQLVRLGKTARGDVDCTLMPLTLPEPATASGVPDLGDGMGTHTHIWLDPQAPPMLRVEALLTDWEEQVDTDPHAVPLSYAARRLRKALTGTVRRPER